MKAVRIDGQTPGGKRTKLADKLPLDTPYVIQVFPIYACNLACDYCIHSVPREKRKFVTDRAVLDYNVYKKFIDDLTKFPRKLKMLRFAGTGEPLLHPDIAAMMAYAKHKQVADSLDIVTNGIGLSREMSTALVKAGVDRIRISIQGLDDNAYSYTKREGIFKELVANIAFLYENRGNTKIYVKIIDCALHDENEFFNIFGDIADFIAIEHLIPAVEQIDYSKLAGKMGELTQNGNHVSHAAVCPQPFYMMQLNPDGFLVPCCAMETAIKLGDAAKESVQNIWQGEVLKNFRLTQLAKEKSIYEVCKVCQQYRYAMFEEDVLDDRAAEIIGRL